MPKLSRRLLLFAAAVLLALAAPFVVLALWGVYTAVTPPVAGTTFMGFDNWYANSTCADTPSTKGGSVLVCSGALRVDSLFAVVDHNTVAVAWCGGSIDNAHYDVHPPGRLGPLIMGPLVIAPMPVVPSDWGDCLNVVPRRNGLSWRLILKH